MTARNILLLLGLGFLPLASSAQQPDSLAFEQGRLRIWCETARFVYEDNGADSLLPSVNCQSWDALQNSTKSTDASLGVMRLMQSVDKSTIYQGYSTNEAKLQKLVSEITTRLKQSPVRRTNAQRLNRVDSLGSQLMLIARRIEEESRLQDPMAAVPTSEVEVTEEASTEAAAPHEVVETETTMPWNELLQWLALLALAAFTFWRLRDLETRYKRVKKENRELEQQVNSFMINTLAPSAPVAAPAYPTPEREQGRSSKDEARSASPAAMPLPPPPQPRPAESAAAAGPKANPPAAHPPIENQGPVPGSTKLPQAPVLAATPEPDGEMFYDKMPFRGGFHQNEMSRDRQRDSLYTIRLMPGSTSEAEYWITEDAEVQRYAMQNGLSFFEEGCEFDDVEENPGRVVNEQKGRLRKDGAIWKILQKARVRFE